MRPVRVDSKMPNGAMSFMNESIRDGLAELGCERSFVLVDYLEDAIRAFGAFVCRAPKGIQGGQKMKMRAYTSTIQLLVLISNTFPPN